MLGAKLSEYHTETAPFPATYSSVCTLGQNSDAFIFDNQFLAQVFWLDCAMGEVTCLARYMTEASSINSCRSVVTHSAASPRFSNLAGQNSVAVNACLP